MNCWENHYFAYKYLQSDNETNRRKIIEELRKSAWIEIRRASSINPARRHRRREEDEARFEDTNDWYSGATKPPFSVFRYR